MIENFKKIFKLKNYIFGHITFLLKLKAFKKKHAYLALLLGAFTIIFEGLGVSILVPLLSFIQVNGDLNQFKESSLLSLYLYNFFSYFNIEINMFLLSIIATSFIFLRQLVNYFNQVVIQKICSRIHKKVNIES